MGSFPWLAPRAAPGIAVCLLVATLLAAPVTAEKFVPADARLPAPLLDAAVAWSGDAAYIMGGRNTSMPQDAILRFDPATGGIAPVATLPSPRQSASGAWLNGTAYAFGGADVANVPLDAYRTVLQIVATNEVVAYHPENGTVEVAARLPSTVFATTAAAAEDAAYVLGGVNVTAGQARAKDWVLRFDPDAAAGERVERVATLPRPVRDGEAVWSGEHVYLFGGWVEEQAGNSTLVGPTTAIVRFTPHTGAVETIPARLPEPGRWMATVAADGSAYLFGGCVRECQRPNHVRTVVRFDFATESVTSLWPAMPEFRSAAMAVYDGEAITVLGGRTDNKSRVHADALRFIPGPTEPTAPRNLTATATSDGVALTWGASVYDGGAPVTAYQVERALGDGAFEVVGKAPGHATAHTDATAAPGRAYQYRVAAAGPGGQGPAAPAVAVETPPAPPGVPTAVEAVGAAGGVLVRWQAPAEDGGRDVTRYVVYREDRGPVEVTGRNLLDGDLASGANYTYRVAAINALGEGPRSDPVTATPHHRLPPPQALTAEGNATTIRLRWTPPAAGDAGAYAVYRGDSPDALARLAQASDTAYDDRAVERGRAYWYAVAAVNATGEGVATQPLRGAAVTLPGAPRNLTVSVADEGATVRWDPPANAGGAERLTYTVRRQSPGVFEYVHGDAPLTATAWVDRNMDPGVTYGYWVEAVNGAGAGPAAGPVEATGPQANQAPVARLDVTPVRVDAGDAVAFDAAASSDGDGAVVEARFDFGDGSDTGWLSQLSAEHAYDAPGTYRVSLHVRDDAGVESARPAEALVVVEGDDLPDDPPPDGGDDGDVANPDAPGGLGIPGPGAAALLAALMGMARWMGRASRRPD